MTFKRAKRCKIAPPEIDLESPQENYIWVQWGVERQAQLSFINLAHRFQGSRTAPGISECTQNRVFLDVPVLCPGHLSRDPCDRIGAQGNASGGIRAGCQASRIVWCGELCTHERHEFYLDARVCGVVYSDMYERGGDPGPLSVYNIYDIL